MYLRRALQKWPGEDLSLKLDALLNMNSRFTGEELVTPRIEVADLIMKILIDHLHMTQRERHTLFCLIWGKKQEIEELSNGNYLTFPEDRFEETDDYLSLGLTEDDGINPLFFLASVVAARRLSQAGYDKEQSAAVIETWIYDSAIINSDRIETL